MRKNKGTYLGKGETSQVEISKGIIVVFMNQSYHDAYITKMPVVKPMLPPKLKVVLTPREKLIKALERKRSTCTKGTKKMFTKAIKQIMDDGKEKPVDWDFDDEG